MVNSTITLLGTLRELHTVLPDYDLQRLRDLVAEKKPDLLCVEIDRTDWEAGNLSEAPIESREALAGLSRTSEITLIPIGEGGHSWHQSGIALPRRGIFASMRRWLSQKCDDSTMSLMRLAGGARAINSPIVEHLCGMLCDLQLLIADSDARRAWQVRNETLLEGVVWILSRDPGRRILVALDCRRKHWLRRQLKSAPNATVVDFWKF
ncbi:MAG: hypothetical protein M1358_13005 [Chloroflexi bacterium]|nr:hypothetical protein [Chloroflexota bacterium]